MTRPRLFARVRTPLRSRRGLLLALVGLGAVWAGCATPTDECVEEYHCEYDGDDAVCEAGYRWEDPDDEDNFVCVPVPTVGIELENRTDREIEVTATYTVEDGAEIYAGEASGTPFDASRVQAGDVGKRPSLFQVEVDTPFTLAFTVRTEGQDHVFPPGELVVKELAGDKQTVLFAVEFDDVEADLALMLVNTSGG